MHPIPRHRPHNVLDGHCNVVVPIKTFLMVEGVTNVPPIAESRQAPERAVGGESSRIGVVPHLDPHTLKLAATSVDAEEKRLR